MVEGPSGLVFARLLELGGITDYVIYERDESATPGPWQQGGTLDLHGPSGQLALKRAGLFDKFSKDLARWEASGLHIVDSRGATVIQVGEGSDRPEIDRLRLRQLLLDSVPAHKIRWGHAVSTVERNTDSPTATGDNGCIIRFVNGTSATRFRLIVGADGAWSKVRPLLLLSSRDFYATWAPELKALVETAEGPFRAWPLYRMEPELVGWARSVAPGVTLLGDAAHLSTPFAGEGVNCSMYDAVVLADRIIEGCGMDSNLANMENTSLEKALTACEEDMFLRGRDLIRRSTKSETMLFHEGATALFSKFLGLDKQE
ncbi:hypothetical protein AFLA70_25g005581 [Aspergillus flavus AF70]|nr:hypothetical protein AFLA70_25g005581 [Aspergillus flavus AF70]